jgi:hypothetical protein
MHLEHASGGDLDDLDPRAGAVGALGLDGQKSPVVADGNRFHRAGEPERARDASGRHIPEPDFAVDLPVDERPPVG